MLSNRHSLVIWTLAAYLAFIVAGLMFEPILVVWPHLFLLAIQDVAATTSGESQTIVAMILGVLPVLIVARIRQRRLGERDLSAFDYAWSGLWTTVFTLAGVTLSALVVGWILGWHIGD
jgi:hypothetical protein